MWETIVCLQDSFVDVIILYILKKSLINVEYIFKKCATYFKFLLILNSFNFF